MDFDRVAKRLDGVPFTTPERGRVLYDSVLEYRSSHVLELGFAHGVSTCYIAAALDEVGTGRITTMDLASARRRDPNIESLVSELGLSAYVEPVYCETSFTWELRKLIAKHPEPIFDFVFHDGGHTWDVAGYAFFLTDRLLKPGGTMLFDDLQWSLATSRTQRDKPGVRSLPEDQQVAQQVGDVFDLLVSRHSDYETWKTIKGKWGWARKRPIETTRPATAVPDTASV